MKRRIFSIALAVVLVLTTIMSATTAEKAQADSGASIFSSKLDLTNKEKAEWKSKLITKEEYIEYYNSLSKAEKLEMNQRRVDALQRYSDMLSKSMHSSRSSGSWNLGYCTLPRSFTIYPQNTENWCGLACIQSILLYLTGASPTQETFASDLGLSVYDRINNTKMTTLLNNNQSIQNYYYYIPYDLDGMASLIYEAIAINHVPACLLIYTEGGKYWRYDCSDGHYLVSHWIAPSTERIGIADPYSGYVGVPQYYEERYDTVYNVIDHVIC